MSCRTRRARHGDATGNVSSGEARAEKLVRIETWMRSVVFRGTFRRLSLVLPAVQRVHHVQVEQAETGQMGTRGDRCISGPLGRVEALEVVTIHCVVHHPGKAASRATCGSKDGIRCCELLSAYDTPANKLLQ